VTTLKRWMDEQSDADDFERAILRVELDVAPPAGAEGDVLRRVMAVVGPIGPGGGGPSGPVATATGGAAGAGALAKSAATLGGLGKGFALGIGVSIAAATGSHFLGESARPRETLSPSGVSVPASMTSVVTGVANERPAPIRAPAQDSPVESTPPASRDTPTRSGESAGAAAPRAIVAQPTERTPGASSVASFPAADDAALAASRLKEEAALLRRARAELRAGALAAAFATLEASRQRFTAPELFQEREALAIELLYRSGERHAAASRAREFLARFPESPHAAAVRVFVDDSLR
jgi:hypothetical protein